MRIYNPDPGELTARIVDFEGPAKPIDGSAMTNRKRQEKHFHTGYCVIDTSLQHALRRPPSIDLRIGGTKTAEYASIWVTAPTSDDTIHICGFGSASGYGFHKPSEAVAHAIAMAQIAIDGGIVASRGDEAIREALSAIALAIGMDPVTTLIIHTYA